MSEDSLRRYFVRPTTQRSDAGIPMNPIAAPVPSCSPSPPVAGKGKRPRSISFTPTDSNNAPIPTGGSSVLVLRLSTPPRVSEEMVLPVVLHCAKSPAQRVSVDATSAAEAAFHNGAKGTANDVLGEGVTDPGVSDDGREVIGEVPMDLQMTASRGRAIIFTRRRGRLGGYLPG